MPKRIRAGIGVLLLFSALTVVMTWPQARHLATHVPDVDDPLLSIWRIAWIAHALETSPADLLNGNIFYPEQRTLAYTDAVLLQGAVAAPAIWAGVTPMAAYNVLILGSIALSGAAMWLYARRLTGSAPAAVLAGIAFAFMPFRFDHFPHLELQAAMFMPLTLWFLARAFDTGEKRDVWGAMASIVAQVYSGIYCAVFLVTVLVVVVPLQAFALPAGRRAALVRAAGPAVLVAAIAVAPYLGAYVMNRGTLGDRSVADIRGYSATATDYLSTPEANVVYGVWSGPSSHPERRLFPGAIALGLAAIGLVGLDRRRVALLAVGLIGLVVSFGLNTPFYEPLSNVLFVYRGLRVPARASILVFLAIAPLAAYGWARLTKSRGRWTAVATVIVAGAMLLEYATVMSAWLVLPPPPQVYPWLAAQPRSVVVEYPLAEASRLDHLNDGVYMYRSIEHWQPILNGYSGYFPKSFLDLTVLAEGLPDEPSIAYLKQRGVDLIVVHGSLMPPDRFGEITEGLLARPDVRAVARFDERGGPDAVFRLSR